MIAPDNRCYALAANQRRCAGQVTAESGRLREYRGT